MKGLEESIKNICKRYGIQTHFNGNNTIKNILVKSKEKDPLDKKSGAIYWYQCGEIRCDDEYIGKTSRTLGERYKEHLTEPSPIFGHCNISGHSTNRDNFTIIGREHYGLARAIKESIYIRVNNPILNRNVGKYNLNHILDRVLFSTPELIINGNAHRKPTRGHAQTLPPNRHVHRTIEHLGNAQRTLPSEHAHRTSYDPYKALRFTFSSDLMKSNSCLDENLSSKLT